MTDETQNDQTARYSVGELAEAADVSRRAVRFYVQRGLLAPPIGVGRGAHYTDEHLARLKTLRQLQGGGMALDDVARVLDGEEPGEVPRAPASAVVADAWFRVLVAPGVELNVQAGSAGAQVLAELVDALRERLAAHGDGTGRDGASRLSMTRGDGDDDER